MNPKLEQALNNLNKSSKELRETNVRFKENNDNFQKFLDERRNARSAESIPPPRAPQR